MAKQNNALRVRNKYKMIKRNKQIKATRREVIRASEEAKAK